jgi:hypothetical protein
VAEVPGSGPTSLDLAQAWWPKFDWRLAEVRRGAFHEVLVLQGRAVARIAKRIPRNARRHTDKDGVLSSRRPDWRTPRLMAPLRATADGRYGMLVDWIPGRHDDNAPWVRVARELSTLLREAEAGQLFAASGELPERRAWCGGTDFPSLVRTELSAVFAEPAVRKAAADVVDEMLDAGDGVPTGPVHGDLSMHNILWHASEEPSADLRISGLIDLDHAAVADPAIDVAPLLGQFGSAVVGSVVEPETLRRAMLHRATLSLQVAASAELCHDYSLRDFALNNFTRRWNAQTLYDPDGHVPS